MVLSITLCVVFSWNAAAKFLSVVQMYLDKPSYVMSIIKDADTRDYESNEILKDEICKTIDAVLKYTINYQLDENTKFNNGIIYNINSEKQRTQKQIDLVKEILPYQIENNIINSDFIKNGFVDLTENPNGSITLNSKRYDAQINNKKIEQYYISQYDELIENYKLTDSKYEEISKTINDLDGVNYAVVNRNNGTIVSNSDISDQNMIAEHFSEKEYTVIFSSGESRGSMNSFDEYIKGQTQSYPVAFDMYISFDNLAFNDVCKNSENEIKQIRKDMLYSLITAVLFMIMSDIQMFLFIYAAYKNKHVVHRRRTLTAVLITLLTALLIVAAAIIIIIFIEIFTADPPPLGVKVSSNLSFAIIKLCFAMISLYATGIFSLIAKRKRSPTN
ncbi:MAG: hypothetical protein NC122_08605 [Faecalibacterium sp.]|nr:hypothetical protein [Faecalibacterium sp.]